MTAVDAQSIVELLDQHLRWYPLMEVQDIYKLLYQGVLGSEHLLTSPDEFSRYLVSEFELVAPDPRLPLFEPVRADGSLFRLNFGSLKSKQVNLTSVIDPIILTSQMNWGLKLELQHTWDTLLQLVKQGYIDKVDQIELDRFSQLLEAQDYPAVHHSIQYVRSYQPAYRLIAGRFIPLLGLANAG